MAISPSDIAFPFSVKYNPNVNSGMEFLNRCQFTLRLRSKIPFGFNVYWACRMLDSKVWDVVARNDVANAVRFILKLYFLSLELAVYRHLEFVSWFT